MVRGKYGVALAVAALITLQPAAPVASQGSGTPQPTVRAAAVFGISSPVRNLPRSVAPPMTSGPSAPGPGEERSLVRPMGDGSYRGPDAALQPGGGTGIPPTSQNFEGIDIGESSSNGVFVGAPPDTNGDVGPNHYVQIVNTVFAVYSKTGTRLTGPTPINALWESAPNAAEFNCTVQSRGDPIVQYDPLADRWLISQFNFPGVVTIAPPFDQCIAISQTPDPTGPYFLYDFRYSEAVFNDYPHFGVWPDAYYMSVNQFDGITLDFLSAGACAFERQRMLTGDPAARQVCFDGRDFDPGAASGEFIYGGQLPSDLDGTTPPPPGEPNFFLQFLDSTTIGQDKLLEFKFHVDWGNPTNSTFAGPIEIPVADFSSGLCNYDRNCLPQRDSADGLDAISDRLMYRLAYRNFGDHASLVVNHSVDVGDAARHAGVRWYEIRDPNGTPTVHQQSTYAPDAESRWMGSIAMDGAGNIALGYSLTSGDRNPAIAYTARRAVDPLGQMTLGEGLLYQGLGAQQGTDSRWGDYSSMSVDPNGCTFWYTTEHYLGTGEFNWGTRIGSFTLPVCGDPQISLSASSPLVRVRGDFTYSIGVITGQSPAQGVSVAEILPPGVTLLSVASSSGTCQGTAAVVCELGDLPAGALETITLTVRTKTTGDLTSTATLSTSSPDPNPANNAASVTTQVYDPCTLPGAIMATDPAGDQTGTAQQDLTSAAVAEPYFGPGVGKLVFTLKAQNLSPAPQPNAYWYEHFSYGGVAWFVDMETTTNPLAPTFNYGFFAVDPDTSFNTENVVGNADTGTFTSDGTITITLANDKLDPDGSGPKPPPSGGSLLSGIHGETRNLVGVLLVLADSTSGAPYTLSGNDYCAPNAAPVAALQATPGGGPVPLTVSFDASASSDPDPGDTIASYTFTFGDGSTPETQPGPTVSHTYDAPGTYHATLTVTDSRGQESTNTAGMDIQAVAPSSADVSIQKTGPATGHVGQPITYVITVANNGPSAASGVTVTDTMPKNTGFGSVGSTQGNCGPRPHSRLVVCDVGTLASGATARVTLVLKPTAKGSFTNTASVAAASPNDPVSGNNTSSVTTTVSP